MRGKINIKKDDKYFYGTSNNKQITPQRFMQVKSKSLK